MKQTILKLIKCLLIPVGAAYSLIRPTRKITILMYHRVHDGVNKEISVTNADFRWQMAYLKRKGYRVVSLDQALQLSNDNGADNSRYVVLTFDDGYEDFCLNAYPVLREYGYPAIVYLVPGRIDTGDVFWWDEALGESELMSWKQIESLLNSGIVMFGSHSLTHADMDLLNEEMIMQELQRSKETLQQKFAMEIRHFAYPRGIVTKCAMEKARDLYESAVSIFDGDEIGQRGKMPDRMRLKRAPVQRSDGRLLFGARLHGWLAPEGWLKKAMGRF